jgi:hypothetical protein
MQISSSLGQNHCQVSALCSILWQLGRRSDSGATDRFSWKPFLRRVIESRIDGTSPLDELVNVNDSENGSFFLFVFQKALIRPLPPPSGDELDKRK